MYLYLTLNVQWPRLDENTSQVCDDALLTELNAEEMNTVKSSTTLKSAWDCTETFKSVLDTYTITLCRTDLILW